MPQVLQLNKWESHFLPVSSLALRAPWQDGTLHLERAGLPVTGPINPPDVNNYPEGQSGADSWQCGSWTGIFQKVRDSWLPKTSILFIFMEPLLKLRWILLKLLHLRGIRIIYGGGQDQGLSSEKLCRGTQKNLQSTCLTPIFGRQWVERDIETLCPTDQVSIVFSLHSGEKFFLRKGLQIPLP